MAAFNWGLLRRLYSVHWTYYRVLHSRCQWILCPWDRILYNGSHGLDENASRRLRRVRAQVDTRDREPAQLSVEEVSLNLMEQRRYRRQDAECADQGGA